LALDTRWEGASTIFGKHATKKFLAQYIVICQEKNQYIVFQGMSRGAGHQKSFGMVLIFFCQSAI
jgi:hypothetical protein